MKKRTIPVLAAVAVCLALKAFAAGGTESDPLLSVSYLMDVLFPQMEASITEQIREGTAAVLEGALSRVDEIGNAAAEDPSGPSWSYSGQYETLRLKRGDVLTLSVGSGVLWLNGRGTANAGLVCVTSADELPENGELASLHRYLNGGEATAVVTVLSDAAQLSVEGSWLLVQSEEDTTQFYDLVSAKDWFYPGVRFVIDRGLFFGISETEFSPLTNMDRSMLASILYRMEGSPEMEYCGTFSDVAEGLWYTAGVEWAASVGVVSGVGDGSYHPTEPLTREQIASMLYRYAGRYLGMDVSVSGDLTVFTDGDTVSPWAVTSMSWAVGARIISGTNQGALLPGNYATRAEVATMLRSFILWTEAQG